MRIIWKFPLKHQPEPQTIKMPFDARLLHIGSQNDVICIWTSVPLNPKMALVSRTFQVVATGQEYDSDDGLIYLGTVLQGQYVWHIFENEEAWRKTKTQS